MLSAVIYPESYMMLVLKMLMKECHTLQKKGAYMIYVYYGALAITYVIAYLGANSKYNSPVLSRVSKLLIFAVLVIVSGFRSEYSIGDTSAYAHSYRLLASNPEIDIRSRDAGFGLLMLALLKISDNPQILIFTTAFITNLFIVLTLYKYAKPFELGIFLYFGTVLYYVSMNGIRQSMAGAICFWAVKFILKRDGLKYFLAILVASTFHQSALLLLPVYFLAGKKAWSKTFWAIVGISTGLVVVFRPFIEFFVKLVEKTSYAGYGQDILNNSASTNILRIFVALIPIVMAFIVRDRLQKEWPESSIFIFMSLFNLIFYMFSTQYLYFYRLCIYFDLFNLVLIPRLLAFYPRKKSVMIYAGIIVFYLAFSGYQVVGWSDYYRNVLFN